MERLSDNIIVLVMRKTRLEDLIARFNTEEQARFYIEHLGADFNDYKDEHLCYQTSKRAALECLSQLGIVHTIDRDFLSNYIFGPQDVIVALGQDGLVANTMKYLGEHPLIGVNPDPSRWEGVLLPFQIKNLKQIVTEVFSQKRRISEISLAKVQLNTGHVMFGVNDIFIGPKSHISIRYLIQANGRGEHQSSSGIIVSTGLGSTGWFRSLMGGAVGISETFTGRKVPKMESSFPWDADYLYFTVREPWPSKYSQANIVFGKVEYGKELVVVSEMAENGVIFSDGIEKDFIDFNSGTQAIITVAQKKGHLVI